MDETMAARYWCHMCSQMVNPIMEAEIKCPFCQSGFVEEMGSNTTVNSVQDSDPDFGTDRALSLWAPILLGMMSSPRRRRRSRRTDFREGEDNDDDSDNDMTDGNVNGNGNGDHHHHHHHHHHLRIHGGEGTDLDRELESILRRRRRSSATILQLLQGIRAGIASEYGNTDTPLDWDRDRERLFSSNHVNQGVAIQGTNDRNQTPLGSLGDYFVGPGLDLLLQHLAENDPNRHGTPPAPKEAVEALPMVKISDPLQCSVCLDDFKVGIYAKEMPCRHKFHSECLSPWLELHSSCPICRYQLPAGETKVAVPERSRNRNLDTNNNNNNDNNNNNNDYSTYNVENEQGDAEGRSGNGRRFAFPWPFSGLFSSSGGNNASSGSSSSGASGN